MGDSKYLKTLLTKIKQLASYDRLIGVLSHRISWIHTFNSFMKTILFLNLSAGVTAIVLFAIDKKNICANGNSSSNANSCPSFLGTASRDLVIVIASLILAVVLLLQGCACISPLISRVSNSNYISFTINSEL